MAWLYNNKIEQHNNNNLQPSHYNKLRFISTIMLATIEPTVPSYLFEPIDILKDTVLEMTEKAAYKAHSGTYVEGLWDAAPSTILTLIDEEVDWQPMELNLHAGDIMRSYDTEVTDLPYASQVSGNAPFHGYQSEPPIAPVFREERPIGLATPALQALGTLTALLEHDGQAHKVPHLNRYFAQVWGTDVEAINNARYLKPEIRNRSDIDLLKSTRSKTHQLFGYEGEQNYVSTSGGGYTKDSVNDKRYIDWHRISLVMRFIGVNLLMSDSLGRHKLSEHNRSMHFGLTSREFPLIVGAPHAPDFSNLVTNAPESFLSDAMKYSLDYYSSDKMIRTISDRNALSTAAVRLGEGFNVSDIAVATLREALRKPIKSFRLDFRPQAMQSYDITRPGKDNPSFRGLLSDSSIHHQMSPHKAMELVLLSNLLARWTSPHDAELRNILDMIQVPTQLSDEQRFRVRMFPSERLGRNGGFRVWQVLKKFRTDDHQAEVDYVRFCVSIAGMETLDNITDKGQLFWKCIRAPAAFDSMVNILKRTLQQVIHFYNVPRLPDKIRLTIRGAEDEFAWIVTALWTKKRDYWLGHYRQRRLQLLDKGFGGLNQLEKAKLIRYQWLSKWLPNYTALLEPNLEVWPEIKAQDALGILHETAKAFTRKRKQADVNPRSHESAAAYATRIDLVFKPKLKFRYLFDSVHSTAKEMSRDIATVLRKLTEPQPETEYKDILDYWWQQSVSRAEAMQQSFQLEEIIGRDELPDDLPGVEDSDSDDDWAPPVRSKAMNAETQDHPSNTVMVEVEEEDGGGLIPMEITSAAELANDDFGLAFDYGATQSFVLPPDDDDEDILPSFLGKRSPIAEMLERFGKTPDLLSWSLRSNVPVSSLERCSNDDFDRIMEAGEIVFREEQENNEGVANTYDVL
jgi:hypothetical protein